MRKYKFYKEDSIWYIDLKYWIGPKWCLAMVAGADLLLDKLCKSSLHKNSNKNQISLDISSKAFGGYFFYIERKQILSLFGGAVYEGSVDNLIPNTIFKNNQLWLCFVTLFVFLRYPKRIYFRISWD